MQHTFQAGDRVIVGDATKGGYNVSRCGESGVLKRAYEFGYEVALDKQELNRSEGIWYVAYGDLRHDTDFQVGDWVRYVAVGSLALREDGVRGKIMYIANTDSITVDWGGGDIGNHNRKYLVKIQPPQEGVMPPYRTEELARNEDDIIERSIQEKIQLLERQVEKAKCCLETYRDLKKFIDQGKGE